MIEVPRIGESSVTPIASLARALSLPAVAAAHAAGHTLVAAWVRSARNPRLSVLLTSGIAIAAIPKGTETSRGLAMPPGSRGEAIAPSEARSLLGEVPNWTACEGRFHVARSEDSLQNPDANARAWTSTFDDVIASMPRRALGRLVIARPCDPTELEDRLNHLSREIGKRRPQQQGRGAEQIKLEQDEAELRQLEDDLPLGLWHVELWTGGATLADAKATAALLARSGDLAGLPVRIRAASGSSPDKRWTQRFLGSSRLLASLARGPVREFPGVRQSEVPDFDVAPEHATGYLLGDVLDSTLHACARLRVPSETLNRHVFVCGATGSGKSQTVRHLLEQLGTGDESVPWLVVEPAKAEYKVMAGRLQRVGGDVTVIRPGHIKSVPASLNPLEPTQAIVDGKAVRFPLQTHLDLVRALFVASFEATEPFPQILASALTRCYTDLGWNLALSDSFETPEGVLPRYPRLDDLQRTALRVVEDVGYGEEVKNNVRGFVDVRIGSLRLGTPGRFFEGGHPLDLEALVQRNTVIEIEDVGDDKDKAFFIGNVIIRLFELFRLKYGRGQQPLRHVMVLEEAHRLLRAADPDSPAAHSVEIFANLLAEVRAYGQGIVVAEQIPAKIIPDVVKNSALKVMHRLPAADDRDFVGGTMNLNDPQSRYVVSLGRGSAAVHADGMDRPMLVKVPAGLDRESDLRARWDAPLLTRSPACPRRCSKDPCDLRQLLAAGEQSHDAGLVLFVETAAAAHLLGEPLGTPGREWVTRLLDEATRRHGLAARRVLRCGIGHAVDRAIDSRSRYIQRFYDPERLKEAVATAVQAKFKNSDEEVMPDPQWQVGELRWQDVTLALQIAAAELEPNRPHPDTGRWAERGLHLEGDTIAAQLEEVYQRSALLRTPHRPTFLGEPSALEQAAVRLSDAPTPSERFDEAAGFISFRAGWARHWLYDHSRAREKTR